MRPPAETYSTLHDNGLIGEQEVAAAFDVADMLADLEANISEADRNVAARSLVRLVMGNDVYKQLEYRPGEHSLTLFGIVRAGLDIHCLDVLHAQTVSRPR